MMKKKNTKNLSGLEQVLFSDRERMELWLAANWKKCALFSVALAVAAVAVFAVNRAVKKSNAEEQDRLVDTPVGELAAVIEKNPDVKGVPAARLRLARYLASENDLKGAQAQYQACFADENCDILLKSAAGLELAALLEANGDLTGALNGFLAVRDMSMVSDANKAVAVCNAARIKIKSGDLPGAVTLLKNFTATAPVNPADQTAAAAMAQCGTLLAALENGEFAPVKK